MSSTEDIFDKTIEKLDKVSPTFCLAKWLQVTMHLQNGQTHSCHHPKTHHIPLSELKENSTALHNTELKKRLRKQMLNGERPSECDYCWNVEDLKGKHYSDRHIKSSDYWALPEMEKVSQMPWDYNVAPTYVEVSFSNVCNFKCAYCYPHISSSWMAEIKKHGPYPTHVQHNNLTYFKLNKQMPLPNEDENPYVDAFWKWWPELYHSLKVFRITGGEPLLSKNTFRILDYILENPNPKLELGVNSNLGVKSEIVKKFATKVAEIKKNKALANIMIYTSLDTWGAQAEYIRHGLDLNLFQKNLDIIFEEDEKASITIMCTFNLLSIFNFRGLLDFVQAQRALGRNIMLDISYLRHPEFLNIKLLPEHWIGEGQNLIHYMEKKNFLPYEIIKMRRLVDYMSSPSDEVWLRHNREDFVSFIVEHDRRRNVSFRKNFKEFRKDFAIWQGAKPYKYLKDFFYQIAGRL